jgi:hypothetical protein
MVELEDLRQFGEHPPLAPPPLEQLERRVEQRRRRRWGTTALVVAAVLVAAGVALASRGSENELRTIDQDQSEEASKLLLDLAARSEAQGWPTTAENPILYETREGITHSGVATIDAEGNQVGGQFENANRMERWWLTQTRKREVGRALAAPRPIDDVATEVARTQPPFDPFFYRGLLVEADYTLPDPPADGITGERERVSQTFPDERSEGRLFDGMSEQLQLAHADGTKRAGWQRLLAGVDGMVVVPDATDRLGRSGVGILFVNREHGETEHLLIFDPATGALLGARSRVVSVERDAAFDLPFVESDLAFTVQAVAEAPQPDLDE